MFLWTLCLILAGCTFWKQKEKRDPELIVPVLTASSIAVKNSITPENSTEGYATDLWIKNLYNGCFPGGNDSKLIVEVLESTIIPFQYHISFQVKALYYLENSKVKSEIKVKGSRDILDGFNNAIDKVASDISNEIIKNLHKDYGMGSFAREKKIRRDNSYVESKSLDNNPPSDFVDETVKKIDRFGESVNKIGNSVQRTGSRIADQGSGIGNQSIGIGSQISTEKKTTI